jgi:hypothetical protein
VWTDLLSFPSRASADFKSDSTASVRGLWRHRWHRTSWWQAWGVRCWSCPYEHTSTYPSAKLVLTTAWDRHGSTSLRGRHIGGSVKSTSGALCRKRSSTTGTGPPCSVVLCAGTLPAPDWSFLGAAAALISCCSIASLLTRVRHAALRSPCFKQLGEWVVRHSRRSMLHHGLRFFVWSPDVSASLLSFQWSLRQQVLAVTWRSNDWLLPVTVMSQYWPDQL